MSIGSKSGSLVCVLVLLGLPQSAWSQPDPAELTAACITELERVEEAVSEEDSGMALVLLDMANEPCAEARRSLVSLIEEAPESADAARVALWQMELRRVRLLGSMGECDDARQVVREVSALSELPTSVEVEYARATHTAMACGPRPGVATHGTLTVSPGMADIYQSGTTTGERDLGSLTDYCWGWIPNSPSFTMEVTEAMQVSLSAYSYAGADLVLYVTGPSGPFCNDDWDGLNPAISDYLLAGTYEVYVGEYSSSGYSTEFSLTVSPTALYPTTTVYPTYGEVSVGAGYGRTTLSGSVWGFREAAVAFDPTCAGWIAETPDFRMYVDRTGETWINVTGSIGSDLTLVVDGPSGRFCNDDSSGANPGIHETLTSGSYNVWVGDKAGPSTGVSYGIQFSSYDPMVVLETEPAHGTVELSPGDPPATLSGTVAGVVPASDFFGSSCYGSIGTAPSHRLTLSADAQVEIVSRATGYGDLIIAVSGPAGTFCNDDYESLNPGISRWLTAGDYPIYVGELSVSGAPAPFSTTITVTEGTPPPDLESLTSGLFGVVTVGTSYGTTTMSGTSGGPNRADAIDPSCRGYISEEPSFLVDITDYSYTTIQVLSEGDTTLVLMGPDGVICNDDYSGLNPGVMQYFSPGRYGVWVGSYSVGQAHPFMISFSPEGW